MNYWCPGAGDVLGEGEEWSPVREVFLRAEGSLCLMGETNHSRRLPQGVQCFASSGEGGSNTEEGWENEEMPPRKGMGESRKECPQMAQQVKALPMKAWQLEFKPPGPK